MSGWGTKYGLGCDSRSVVGESKGTSYAQGQRQRANSYQTVRDIEFDSSTSTTDKQKGVKFEFKNCKSVLKYTGYVSKVYNGDRELTN